MAAARRALQTREEMATIARRIGDELGVDCRADEPLGPYLSMRVGGRAAALLAPRDKERAAECVRRLVAENVPAKVLGGGSNLLVDEGELAFVVVHLGGLSRETSWDGCRVRTSAGTPLAVVLREAIQHGCAGLEWAAGLPGSIGGAVVGNAGAFGGETGAHVRAVMLLGTDGRVRRREIAADDFSYRRSFVAPGELVLEVEMELEPGDPDAVRAEVARVNRTRVAGQPKGGHSSGCVFKNPEGDHAGRLIDACGLKGRRVGGAVVSDAHANFVVNEGGATAADVLRLVEDVRSEVLRQTGVALVPEIRVWHADGSESGPAAEPREVTP